MIEDPRSDESMARMFTLQPGDATRYTVIVRPETGTRPAFVAIGAGDRIQGGYEVPFTLSYGFLTEMLKIYDAAEHTGDVQDYHGVAYWANHAGIRSRWTAVVAIMVAQAYQSKAVGGYTCSFWALRAIPMIYTNRLDGETIRQIYLRLDELEVLDGA